MSRQVLCHTSKSCTAILWKLLSGKRASPLRQSIFPHSFLSLPIALFHAGYLISRNRLDVPVQLNWFPNTLACCFSLSLSVYVYLYTYMGLLNSLHRVFAHKTKQPRAGSRHSCCELEMWPEWFRRHIEGIQEDDIFVVHVENFSTKMYIEKWTGGYVFE